MGEKIGGGSGYVLQFCFSISCLYIHMIIYIHMYIYIYAHVQCCRRLLNFVKSCVVCASLQDEKSIWNQFRKAENQAPETAGSWTRGTMQQGGAPYLTKLVYN